MTLIKNKNLLNKAKKILIFQLIFGLFFSILAIPTVQVQAADPLTISQINVLFSDKNATISWQTNRPATGKVEYGTESNNYRWELGTNLTKTNQTITITGLTGNTTYYFRITARETLSEVRSFEQSFITKKTDDNKSPLISKVTTPYITGTTATIQWITDEPATTEVEYGTTINYNKKVSSSAQVLIHDITLSNLIPGTNYHFIIKSKDKDNNASLWFDMTFRTNFSTSSDNAKLEIYNITPTSENDINIQKNSAVITWWTNKLTSGIVRYGTSPTGLSKTIQSQPPRNFNQAVTLTDLQPGTTYYFEIQVKDVFNKQVKTEKLSFRTKSSEQNYQPEPFARILGSSTCDVNLATDLGFYGFYYNLTSEHPDFGQEKFKKGKSLYPDYIAGSNDWYDNQYLSFTKVDQELNFKKFFSFNENKPGDPFYFAVYWRAIINVPKDGTYNYEITSDDDSWVFIDHQLSTDELGYAHAPMTVKKEVFLTAGFHELEIYYAERGAGAAVMIFSADSQLKFHPLPEGCQIQDVLSYNQLINNQNGVVLGVSTDFDNTDSINFGLTGSSLDDSAVSTYACNPNLGYTKIKALYKTNNSPDVWAILETGQKHYITSPTSFNKYQCAWSRIQTVSRATLDSYSNANLVRTPTNSTIYHLFQRPENKWLKINIPSPTIFISYPNNYWGNVARVNELDIAAYPAVKLIKSEASPEVYLIENNNKRQIKDELVFKNLNFEWSEVVELNQIHLDSYENSSVID